MRVWNKRDKNAPADAVYVGRPTKWGNPYSIGPGSSREQVIESFRVRVLPHLDVSDLRGKDLVCWCAPADCHADLLMEKANA